MRSLMRGFLVVTACFLVGCSWLPNHRLDYQSVTQGVPLALPAGMQMNEAAPAYAVPDKGPLLAPAARGRFAVAMPEQLPSIVEQQRDHKADTAGPAPDVQKVRSVMANDGNGYPMIMMQTRFAWAWEYVGTALKKSGIDVTDKDRAAGLYFIRLGKNHEIKDRDAEIKLSHTTNGIQVVAMNKKGTELLDKALGRVLLARLYAEL